MSYIKPVSDRRAEENKRYRFLRGVRYSLTEGCRLDLPMCESSACDVHHRQGKGASGRFLDVDNWLPACRPCHEWVTVNPAEAETMGLVQSMGSADPTGSHVATAKCRACFHPLFWCHTEAGESVPVEATADDNAPVKSDTGTVRFMFEQPGFFDTDPVRFVVRTREDAGPDELLWVEHRLRCPLAKRIGADTP